DALTTSAETGGRFKINNCVVVYPAGMLTVNQAPLDITANSDSKTYGQVKTYGAGSTAFTTGAGQLKNSETIGSVTITDTNGGGLDRKSVVEGKRVEPGGGRGGKMKTKKD